jgi:hypothetical protein
MTTTSLPRNVILLPLAECLNLLQARRIGWLAPNGNYWTVRQNGAVKQWARRPLAYKIPVKMGSARFWGTLTESTWFDTATAPYVREGIFAPGQPSYRIFSE